MLAAVYEKLVERSEAGPLGQWVSAAEVVVPEAAQDCADAVVGEGSRLASRLVAEPPVLESAVWSQVRRSILDTVAQDTVAQEVSAHEAPAQPASRAAPGDSAPLGGSGAVAASGRAVLRSVLPGWKVFIAGAAASVAIGFLVVAGGSAGAGDPVELPQFAIVDLGRAPDMDFVVARYGLRH